MGVPGSSHAWGRRRGGGRPGPQVCWQCDCARGDEECRDLLALGGQLGLAEADAAAARVRADLDLLAKDVGGEKHSDIDDLPSLSPVWASRGALVAGFGLHGLSWRAPTFDFLAREAR